MFAGFLYDKCWTLCQCDYDVWVLNYLQISCGQHGGGDAVKNWCKQFFENQLQIQAEGTFGIFGHQVKISIKSPQLFMFNILAISASRNYLEELLSVDQCKVSSLPQGQGGHLIAENCCAICFAQKEHEISEENIGEVHLCYLCKQMATCFPK